MGGFLWEHYQNRRISQAEISASRAASDAAHLGDKIQTLEKRIERLLLLNRAMWSVIEEQTGLTEADLTNRIEVQMEIAASTHQATARACPQCGRTLNPKQDRCLYCGTPRTYTSLFDQF